MLLKKNQIVIEKRFQWLLSTAIELMLINQIFIAAVSKVIKKKTVKKKLTWIICKSFFPFNTNKWIHRYIYTMNIHIFTKPFNNERIKDIKNQGINNTAVQK